MNKVDASAEILLLEDYDKPLTTLAESLAQEDGFRVESASSSRDVLKLVRKRRPDLILLDLTPLGEEFGITLCEKIV